jgi:hypothetical protein
MGVVFGFERTAGVQWISRTKCGLHSDGGYPAPRRTRKIQTDQHALSITLRGPPLTRRLCSRFDEQRDSDEGNNYQGGTSDEHVTDIISCGARSHSYLVVISDDRTFVRIHRTLLSWAQSRLLLETRGRLACSDALGAQLVAVRRSSYVDRMTLWYALTHIVAHRRKRPILPRVDRSSSVVRGLWPSAGRPITLHCAIG